MSLCLGVSLQLNANTFLFLLSFNFCRFELGQHQNIRLRKWIWSLTQCHYTNHTPHEIRTANQAKVKMMTIFNVEYKFGKQLFINKK